MAEFARDSFDRHMMRIALAMARTGLGQTGVNPSVGAVIADETTGEVIARGVTQPGGRPHAEKEALRLAGVRARGKTMYVTLEPCAHTGRTPTSADSVFASGITRLVCAMPDPNPVIAGRGLADLAAAGMRVDVGLLAEDAQWVTRGHVLRQTEGHPFVQIKMAIDRDGAIAAGDGAPVWVTSPEARAYAHLLRAKTHAIVVGAGTVIADNPALTCRLPGMADRSPLRVIISGKKRLPPAARVLHPGAGDPRTLIVTAADARGAAATGDGVATLDVAADRDGWPAPAAIAAALAVRGAHRILVEGGPRLWSAFLAAGIADEVLAVIAPTRATGRVIEVIDGDPDRYFAGLGLVPSGTRTLGPDRLHVYRRPLP